MEHELAEIYARVDPAQNMCWNRRKSELFSGKIAPFSVYQLIFAVREFSYHKRNQNSDLVDRRNQSLETRVYVDLPPRVVGAWLNCV
jgi:hypothetical protein